MNYWDKVRDVFGALFTVFMLVAASIFMFKLLVLDDKEKGSREFKEDNGLYFVVDYKPNGAVRHQILCDSVRKDEDKKEVVVREWQTGEYYIFAYPVSITDVTYAKEYIKFTNMK